MGNPELTQAFSFLDLPTEIRLVIYEMLLVSRRGPGLCSCRHPRYLPVLSPTESSASPALLGNQVSGIRRSKPCLIQSAILGTCKKIYHEAMPVLYDNGVFRLLCLNQEHERLRFDGRRNLHSALRPSRCLICPVPHTSSYVKQGLLTYISEVTGYSDMTQYPRCWRRMERELLKRYPNIQSIFLQFSRDEGQLVCLKLVPRHPNKHATGGPGPSLEAMLGDVDLLMQRKAKEATMLFEIPVVQRIWEAIGDLCCAIWHAETHGQMEKTAFAVQAIRWASGSTFDLAWEQSDQQEIYMGWERNIVRDDQEPDPYEIYAGCDRILNMRSTQTTGGNLQSDDEGRDGELEASPVEGRE